MPPLEVMVVGSGPAAPQPDSPGSGLLLRSGGEALLIDCGPGTIGRLRRFIDPCTLCGVVVTHFHADHYLDLIALRYLLPWAGTSIGRLNVYLPPGGTARLETLAEVIDERTSFFADAFDICEYDPSAELVTGPFRMRFVPSRHYVPAWGVDVSDPAGRRVFYTGDTGPNPELAPAARGAALLVIEATLDRAEDDVVERGHLSLDEAIDVGRAAGVGRMLLTHFPAERRAQIRARSNGSRPRIQAARPGLRIKLDAVPHPGRHHEPGSR